MNSACHTLSILKSKGVLSRIGRGLYINRANGITPRCVEIIPWILRGNEYYFGLNAAANYWGLTPQMPRGYYVIYLAETDAERKRTSRWYAELEEKQRYREKMQDEKEEEEEERKNAKEFALD